MTTDSTTITVHSDVLIPVRGETVAANRYEPTGVDGPVPALLMYVPYHKDDYVTYGGYEPWIRYLAENGYEVVVADMVGTGASSGVKEKPFEAAEGKEAAAIVDWLADREWCDGSVGMFGKSYGGITALKGAAERPDALGAILPTHAPYLGFRDYYMGGAFSLYGMGGHWTPLMQALQAKPPGRRDPAGRWADVWHRRLDGLRDGTPWLFQFLEHAENGEYWEEMDIPVDRIRVPTFTVSGWRDGYPHTTMEFFERIDAEKRILLGPWRHVIPHRGRETKLDFMAQTLEWFDYHLKSIENGAADAPRIAVWTETEGGGEPDAGVWQTLDEWPWLGENADEVVSLSLTSDGAVPADEFVDDGRTLEREYRVDQTVGVDSADFGKPLDTAPDDARSLTFETAPLDGPVELTGSGAATLRFSLTTADANLVVRVVDVAPDGSARLVTHGMLRASHRESHHSPAPVPVDETVAADVPLKAKSHLFESGHRIRIAVSGAFFPTMMPAPEQGTLTLRSGPGAPCVVSFPGRRYAPGETVEADVAFPAPDGSVPTEPQAVVNGDELIEIRREHVDDAAGVRTVLSKTVDTPDGRLEYTEEIAASVAAREPLSAAVSRRTDIAVDRGDERVEVVATSRASHASAQATTRVHVDEERLFDETWSWRRQE